MLTSFGFSDFPYGASIALFSCVDDQEKENDNQRDSTKDKSGWERTCSHPLKCKKDQIHAEPNPKFT